MNLRIRIARGRHNSSHKPIAQRTLPRSRAGAGVGGLTVSATNDDCDEVMQLAASRFAL
jgi:hypothetical protein